MSLPPNLAMSIFEKVRAHMGTMLESGLAETLDEAYERAIYADPEICSSLIAATQQAEQGKRLTELNAKTERAKSAAVSVTGAPGGGKVLNGSLDRSEASRMIGGLPVREVSGRM